ncbi:MAG TPA: prepilin-type N-terminal cleavage/methylation domain-containing protein [Vicinamibacterales bacterium]|nr:prepilin-type N-terminal cleavage/methylation domain-containing protein [Vicinamibacterales bacterium]
MSYRLMRGFITNGFTLVEVIVAMGLMVVICLGVAPLFVLAMTGVRSARGQTLATIYASAKIEELRSLTWAYETRPAMTPILRTDVTTNLSGEQASADGAGLLESPAGTLDANIPPYVDYLDARGVWVGTGPHPAARAAFIRRWSVHRAADDPEHTLVLQVLVVPVAEELGRARAGERVWTGRDALIATTMTRKASR